MEEGEALQIQKSQEREEACMAGVLCVGQCGADGGEETGRV